MGFFKDIKEKLVGKSTKQNEKYVAGLDKSSSTFSDRINELAARFREINDEYFEELESNHSVKFNNEEIIAENHKAINKLKIFIEEGSLCTH